MHSEVKVLNVIYKFASWLLFYLKFLKSQMFILSYQIQVCQ